MPGLPLLRRLNHRLARAAQAAVALLVFAMVAAITWQIITRALLGKSPPWTEEVALLMFGWVVLLMTAVCTRERMHLRADLLLDLLPGAWRPAAEALISMLSAAIGAYLLWSGVLYLLEMRGSTSQAIRYPSEWLYAAVPVSATLLTLFALENALTPPGKALDAMGAAPRSRDGAPKGAS